MLKVTPPACTSVHGHRAGAHQRPCPVSIRWGYRIKECFSSWMDSNTGTRMKSSARPSQGPSLCLSLHPSQSLQLYQSLSQNPCTHQCPSYVYVDLQARVYTCTKFQDRAQACLKVIAKAFTRIQVKAHLCVIIQAICLCQCPSQSPHLWQSPSQGPLMALSPSPSSCQGPLVSLSSISSPC